MSSRNEAGGKTTGRGQPGPGHGRKFETAKDFRKSLRRLLGFFGKDKALFILAVFFILVSVILNTTAPAVLGAAITNHLELSLDGGLFVDQMYVLLLIYFCGFIANVISTVSISIMSNRVVFRMRREGFEHIQRLSVSYFGREGKGDTISRLTNDIETISSFLSNGLISTINAVFSLIGILIAMLVLNVPLTFSVLLTVPVIGVIMVIIGRRVRAAAKERQKQVGSLSSTIEESVTGMKVIQSFHREEHERQKFDRVNGQTRDASVKMETVSYMMMPLIQLVNIFGLVFVIGIGGILTILNPSVYSIGLLTSFIVYSRRFFEPMRQIANVYNLFQSAMAGSERIFEVFDSTEEIPEPEESLEVKRVQGDVSFSNVSFGYDPDKIILNDLNFKTSAGEVTAIVGPTGAGKTTIINLLGRFYDIDKGAILLDGKDIRSYRKNDLRRQMGIVLQEPFFFASTIRENLLYGKPDAGEEEIVEAARLANAHHFITRMPEGYETKLTERGMNLSQGERQLLAIARTILADPALLILDEATSSIDSLTESHIQEGLIRLMKGRTSFIIAHRLSTIKNADRILVVHDHRIIEEGSHRELMAAEGYYHRLYSIQFKKAEITEDMEI